MFFLVPGGQFEFRVSAFGLHGMSSLLMRYMHDIFARPRLVFDYNGHPVGVQDGITQSMMGRFVAVYMDTS